MSQTWAWKGLADKMSHWFLLFTEVSALVERNSFKAAPLKAKWSFKSSCQYCQYYSSTKRDHGIFASVSCQCLSFGTAGLIASQTRQARVQPPPKEGNKFQDLPGYLDQKPFSMLLRECCCMSTKSRRIWQYSTGQHISYQECQLTESTGEENIIDKHKFHKSVKWSISRSPTINKVFSPVKKLVKTENRIQHTWFVAYINWKRLRHSQ